MYNTSSHQLVYSIQTSKRLWCQNSENNQYIYDCLLHWEFYSDFKPRQYYTNACCIHCVCGNKSKNYGIVKKHNEKFFISFFINLFFVPMIICGTYQRYGLDNETKMQIIKFTQYFTPVLVLTWLLSSFTKYVDQTGNEIFFFQIFGYYSWKPASLQEFLSRYVLLIVISLIFLC